MGGGVNYSKAVDTDPCVTLSGLEASVPEHLGDVADVRPSFQHQSGNGMAK
jgi:hypothetical protein